MVIRTIRHKVIEAATSAEAVRIAQEQTTDIGLLLTDVLMPLMEVLYTFGYTNDPRIRRGPGGSSEPFISKPFTPRELAQKVREVLYAVPPSEAPRANSRERAAP